MENFLQRDINIILHEKPDIVGFSISFEMDYPNVVRILQMSDISLLADERSESAPYVIAGGAIGSSGSAESATKVVDLIKKTVKR